MRDLPASLYAYSTRVAPTSPRNPMPPTTAGEPTSAAQNEPSAKEAWGRWLTAKMDERGLAPGDLVRLLGGWDSAQVGRWRSGASGASVDAAVAIARALRLPPSEVLHAAGHTSVANLLQQVAAGQSPANPSMPDPEAAIEALAAGVTEGLKPQDAARMRAQLREDVQLVVELTQAKAEKLRQAAQDQRDAGAS